MLTNQTSTLPPTSCIQFSLVYLYMRLSASGSRLCSRTRRVSRKPPLNHDFILSPLLDYECALTLMRAYNETCLGEGGSSPNTLYCISKTLAFFRKMLASDDGLSDYAIAIVLSLINQEQVRHNHFEAEVHVAGLERMVDLRGGLEAIQENRPLVLKICK